MPMRFRFAETIFRGLRVIAATFTDGALGEWQLGAYLPQKVRQATSLSPIVRWTGWKPVVRVSFCLPLALTAVAVHASDHSPGQLQHHPDIRVELFASEPMVVDPVSLTFAANGDCYVIEMRDYPYGMDGKGAPGGRVRILRDNDGDGQADEAKIFAEGLSFPTSIMAWRDGVLVCAPPQIIYLKDSTGDNRADLRRVVLDGLELGVTDSNANSLRFALDNCIHVANGGNGGKVTFPESPEKAWDVGNCDFAFDPDRQLVEKTSHTGGGFGLVFDAFGHSFTTHNINYLQQRVMPVAPMEANPAVRPFDTTVVISAAGPMPRVFPVVQAVTRVNHPEQAGHFSSAGGMAWLEAGQFSDRLSRSVFVCDVVTNLVHRDVVDRSGVAFVGRRAPEEQEREFIASADPSFRPVGMEHGPDGALYLMDMQRDVIEHPDYIPAKVLKDMDIRGGDQRGRIYRVVPVAGLARSDGLLHDADTESLVAALADRDTWRRDTAHRLLWERQAEATVAALRAALDKSELPAHALVRILWLLNGFNALGSEPLQQAAEHEHSFVREHAIRLMGSRGEDRERWLPMILTATKDDHPRVAFQAALALAKFNTAEKIESLFDLLQRYEDDAWIRRSVWIGIGDESLPLLKLVWQELQATNDSLGVSQELLTLEEMADLTAASGTDDAQQELLDWILNDVTTKEANQLAALAAGLTKGWERRPAARFNQADARRVANAWFSSGIAGWEPVYFDFLELYELPVSNALQERVDEQTRIAGDQTEALQDRIAAVELLARVPSAATIEAFRQALARSEPPSLQQAVIAALRRTRHAEAARIVTANWSALSPTVRSDAINLLLSRRGYHEDLLDALEAEAIDPAELNLDLEQRRTLLRWSSDAVAKRASQFFGDEEYSNRRALVEEWLDKLPAEGDAQQGVAIYQKRCATCHISHEFGHRVGPDLTGLAHRSVEDLLSHILDPSMAINPNYVSCTIETQGGQILTGLLKQEAADAVVLLQEEAKEIVVPREEIAEIRTLKTSLMPEGLEKELSAQDFRDVIAFIQEQDVQGLEIPPEVEAPKQ